MISAVRQLATSEQETVRRAIRAVVEGPFIDDWEFRIRLGLHRGVAKSVLSSLPNIDDSASDSDAFLVINNCLNEVVSGIPITDADWLEWFSESREEVKRVYEKWARLHGLNNLGLR
jgi:hypothetical protein